jgi:hypothetical protein
MRRIVATITKAIAQAAQLRATGPAASYRGLLKDSPFMHLPQSGESNLTGAASVAQWHFDNYIGREI